MIPIVFLLHPCFWAYAYHVYNQYYPHFSPPHLSDYPYAAPSPLQAYPQYSVPGSPSVPPCPAPTSPGSYPDAGAQMSFPTPMFNPELFIKIPQTAQLNEKQQLVQMKESLAAQLKQIEDALSAFEKA